MITTKAAIASRWRRQQPAAAGDPHIVSAENQLSLINGTNRLYYDALGRLVNSTATALRFDWDGEEMATIYTGGTTIQRRFVFGPGTDEPLVWYEGSGIADRRWIHADERGSTIAISNAAGNASAINAYDEYGVPKAGNSGRFQYTGQMWLPELGMYSYKARIYAPSLGRFMQTDPIGHAGGVNLYGYVGGDPVNRVDPSGLFESPCRNVPGGCARTTSPNTGPTDPVREPPPPTYVVDAKLPDPPPSTALGDFRIMDILNSLTPLANFNTDNQSAGGAGSQKGDDGKIVVTATIPPKLPGGPYTVKPSSPGNRLGSYQGPVQPSGPRSQAQWVPPEAQGGPPGSKGYWKVQLPGQKGWNRFGSNGQPLTPNQAHPSPIAPTRPFFFLGPVGAFFVCALPRISN